MGSPGFFAPLVVHFTNLCEQKNPVARDTDESTRDYQARRGWVARENVIRRTLNMISVAKGVRLVDMENRRIIYRVGCRW